MRSYGSVQGCVKNAREAQCCTRDEGGPFGAGVQAQTSNSRKLLSSHGDGGERYGEGVSEMARSTPSIETGSAQACHLTQCVHGFAFRCGLLDFFKQTSPPLTTAGG